MCRTIGKHNVIRILRDKLVYVYNISFKMKTFLYRNNMCRNIFTGGANATTRLVETLNGLVSHLGAVNLHLTSVERDLKSRQTGAHVNQQQHPFSAYFSHSTNELPEINIPQEISNICTTIAGVVHTAAAQVLNNFSPNPRSAGHAAAATTDNNNATPPDNTDNPNINGQENADVDDTTEQTTTSEETAQPAVNDDDDTAAEQTTAGEINYDDAREQLNDTTNDSDIDMNDGNGYDIEMDNAGGREQGSVENVATVNDLKEDDAVVNQEQESDIQRENGN